MQSLWTKPIKECMSAHFDLGQQSPPRLLVPVVLRNQLSYSGDLVLTACTVQPLISISFSIVVCNSCFLHSSGPIMCIHRGSRIGHQHSSHSTSPLYCVRERSIVRSYTHAQIAGRWTCKHDGQICVLGVLLPHVHARARIHTHTQTHNTHVHTCIHTHTTCTHTHTHTHHMHTYTTLFIVSLVRAKLIESEAIWKWLRTYVRMCLCT